MSGEAGSSDFRDVIKAHYEFLEGPIKLMITKLVDYNEQRCYQK